MPALFTRMFADRLNVLCAIRVREAADGDAVEPGLALVAPGGRQMRLGAAGGGGYLVRLEETDPVCGHCPSVEALFQSVAKIAGADAVGVMLTGMGRDGARGMKAMRDAGARTLAQDADTSVVFGMPREAHLCGGAERLVPLPEIGRAMLDLTREEAR
jgi:two-component system, chemotaxis family, protein-glutamate methylesterase/glutaminase